MNFTVEVIVEADAPLTEDQLFDIAELGGSAGGAVGGTRFDTGLSVEAQSFGDAVEQATESLLAIVPGSVVSAEAMTFEEEDRRLSEPAFPELAGVSEVAEYLAITRQRLAVLRKRPDFPAPVTVLAAGPIWRKGDLSRFADGWQRKAGRPLKAKKTESMVPEDPVTA